MVVDHILQSSVLNSFRNIAFFGITYQSYKALIRNKEVEQMQKGVVNKEVREEVKKNEEQLVRIVMKWITAFLFIKMFWIIEKFIVIIPPAPIKLWLGLWIMLPNFYGEFFMYNLLSDRLDKFEREMRKIRNKIVALIVEYAMRFTFVLLIKFKPYIHTLTLKRFKENTQTQEKEIDRELELRKKLSQSENDQIIRDSSVLNNETIKAFKDPKQQNLTKQASVSQYPRINKSDTLRAKATREAKQDMSKSFIDQMEALDQNAKAVTDRRKAQTNLGHTLTDRMSKGIQQKVAANTQKDVKKPIEQVVTQSQFYIDETIFSDEDDSSVVMESLDRKSQTLSFIQGIDKSFDMLQPQQSKKPITRNVMGKTRTAATSNRYGTQQSLNVTIDEDYQEKAERDVKKFR
ncbi:UNKNOWN [Stylonychia lemnae]|uniref:Uncharacterized protein n=1 Tax=Stylonychia lemnae TaxID=5949 RepID=A0A078B4Q9_STYLE|nr:UNKNOWN [Stylonychia lemnae]|eukprot:CDW88212.1 UNKNOWN [Stylonychia lemnae]